MKETVYTIGSRVSALLRRNSVGFMLIHACFTALGIIIFTPLLGLLFRLVMHFSSRPVLADTEIIFFLLTPYGLLALVVFGALLITVTIFELAAMMAVYIAAMDRLHEHLFQIVRRIFFQSAAIFKFSLYLIVRILLIVLPFLAAAALIGWFALSRYDINYYLTVKPPLFLAAAGVIAIIALAMLCLLVSRLLSWSLALPLVLFSRTKPEDSFIKSTAVVAGSRKVIALALIGWGLSVLVAGLLLLTMLQQLAHHTIPLVYDRMPLLLTLIGLLVSLLFLINFMLTAIASAGFSGLLIELCKHFGQPTALVGLSGQKPIRHRQISIGRLIILGSGALIAALGIGIWLIDSITTDDDLVIVAHRGAAGRAPENTMAAVRAAIEDQADWVEIDVQESADGQVVVVHDSDFMKLSGVDLKVWDGTLEQIRNIDVGSWFAAEFAEQRVPTLAEVLNECRDRAAVVIELKYYGHDERLEERVVNIVEKSRMVDHIAIMSLKYDGVQKIRKLRPDWRVGLLSAQVIGSMSRLDVDFLAVNMAMATPAFIRSNQAAGKQVFVWTVNDRMSLFRMMSLGVDGIITDEPALARQVMAERAELGLVERLLVHTATLFGKSLPPKMYRDASP
jgi:glycerophosphoryl diester phosphodiesterase